MYKALRVTVATAIGIASLSLTAPAYAGNGSTVGAGLVGFGIGAILGSALTPQVVYVVPPPPDYYYDPYYDDPYDYDGPVGYEPPPPSDWYGGRTYPRSKKPPHAAAQGPRPGPARSKTATTEVRTGTVEHASEAKLKAAQAKAEKLGGLEKLTSEDIDGLSREQLKRLRGY
jgi:hypothetical protein